jgi:tRNA (guanine37-N1)-methyltransferase
MSKFLKSVLADTLSENDLQYLYSSYDIIGDIAIIKIPDVLIHKKKAICDALIKNVKNLKAVYMQSGSVAGEYRLRGLEFVSGCEIYLTVYKEYGCKFLVNVATSYFSPRLSTERLRLSKLVKSGEIVLNMFAGVGTFSVIMAKEKRIMLTNIDSNLDAFILSVINSKMNKVDGMITSVHGDAKILLENDVYKDKFDRILLPLPEKSHEFIDISIKCLKPKGGILHFFSHVKSDKKSGVVETSEANIHNLFKKYSYQITHTQIVRAVAPRIYQTVTDLFLVKEHVR